MLAGLYFAPEAKLPVAVGLGRGGWGRRGGGGWYVNWLDLLTALKRADQVTHVSQAPEFVIGMRNAARLFWRNSGGGHGNGQVGLFGQRGVSNLPFDGFDGVRNTQTAVYQRWRCLGSVGTAVGVQHFAVSTEKFFRKGRCFGPVGHQPVAQRDTAPGRQPGGDKQHNEHQ